MASRVEFVSAGVGKRLEMYIGLPRSRAYAAFRGEIRGAVIRGNRDGLLRGTDGRDRTLTPLRSERKGYYAGATGKPLTPFGESSHAIKRFQADWHQLAEARWELVMGWEGFLSRRGDPILMYHILGMGRNPVRHIASIRPTTWAEIRRIDEAFLDRITSPAGVR